MDLECFTFGIDRLDRFTLGKVTLLPGENRPHRVWKTTQKIDRENIKTPMVLSRMFRRLFSEGLHQTWMCQMFHTAQLDIYLLNSFHVIHRDKKGEVPQVLFVDLSPTLTVIVTL